MTIQEVQTRIKTLAAFLSAAVQAFETSTGCVVHSLPVERVGASASPSIRVKVQIPVDR